MNALNFWSVVREDYAAHSGRDDFGRLRLVLALVVSPGYLASTLYRLQDLLWRSSRTHTAGVVRSLNHSLTGADFVSGCQIGPGVVIRHPNGIVIGHGAKVGRGCTILQQVTLGERILYKDGPGEYPTIGDGVILGAGCRILGPVRIGEGAVVGANSVVFIDVPPRSTAVGVPARVLPAQSNP